MDGQLFKIEPGAPPVIVDAILAAHDARIRAEAESATIAAVVAWLRKRRSWAEQVTRQVANEIERGDWRPTPGKEPR